MHRVHRWLPCLAALALLGFLVVVATDARTAQADAGARGGRELAEPCRRARSIVGRRSLRSPGRGVRGSFWRWV
jgi:hypothetical protein